MSRHVDFNVLEPRHYTDLRNRCAYVHATGAFPTHLRPATNQLLRALSTQSPTPTSLDQRSGVFALTAEAMQGLAIEDHVLIQTVKQYVAASWRIVTSLGPNHRRPFSRVRLERGTERVTVQYDGSILDRWR